MFLTDSSDVQAEGEMTSGATRQVLTVTFYIGQEGQPSVVSGISQQ